MEEIKNLFVKHFGFLPDVISTTEHAYISPPSRIISIVLGSNDRFGETKKLIEWAKEAYSWE